MRFARIIFPALIALVLVYTGANSVGPAPALGRFLDPVTGVWAVAATAQLPREASAQLAGLGAGVEIIYDDRGVPHIFAATREDAVSALGYVVARDRLFQLELQTRATAGTLTELVGATALPVDRFQRSLAMAWSADREWEAADKSSSGARMLRAYADGVNGWIDGMGPRDLPLEYRLLSAQPMRWEAVHSLYITRRMGYTLTYSSHELWRHRVVELVGEDATKALFPIHAPIQEPIQPGSREAYPWLDRTPLPPPSTPSTSTALPAHSVVSVPAPPGSGSGEWGRTASNNWVVGPSRSATGNAILAGDPHLDLTLPSIWYEVHIVVPGEMDVYGVTIPGVPTVLIGFNRDVAGSFTNVGADVMDYFHEELDDLENPTSYLLDGSWVPLSTTVEEYYDPSGSLIARDTIHFTHRGPIRFNAYLGPLSIRWTNLEANGIDQGEGFMRAALARSVDELLMAMEGYSPSAQNMVMADRAGAIAIRSTGRYPLRPDGKGYEVRDGSTGSSDWDGQWPIARYPMGRDPRQGYLASANQEPLDPTDDSSYLGINWPSPWRAMRINRLLRDDTSVTVDDMRRFQTDPGNEKAEVFVPLFLRGAVATTDRTDETDAVEAVAILSQWDRRYTRDNRAAILFELALTELKDRVWDELIPPAMEGGGGRRVATPSEQVLWRVVQDPHSVWCDDRRTSVIVETCDDLLAWSLTQAYRMAVERYGDPSGDGWRWERLRHTNIWHLLHIGSLSALDLSIQGGPGTLSPSSGSGIHGASWRMVVELGDRVEAWTTYPGGQSGNPASQWYDDRIAMWQSGELEPALVPESPAALPARRIASRLVLEPSGR